MVDIPGVLDVCQLIYPADIEVAWLYELARDALYFPRVNFSLSFSMQSLADHLLVALGLAWLSVPYLLPCKRPWISLTSPQQCRCSTLPKVLALSLASQQPAPCTKPASDLRYKAVLCACIWILACEMKYVIHPQPLQSIEDLAHIYTDNRECCCQCRLRIQGERIRGKCHRGILRGWTSL